MNKISGTIITLNEEKNIQACIESLQKVCSEIVVLDSESTDRTVEIAQQLGAKVVIQSYLGDGKQKAFAADQAENDWVLSIDADERLDQELIQSINELDLTKTQFDAFILNRKTFIGQEWIKVWYPDCIARLYNRHKARYEPKKGHAKVIHSQSKKLDGNILHYSYSDHADLINQNAKFCIRSANMLTEKNKNVGPFSPALHALSAFIRKYFLKKGFLYGESGLTIAISTAYSSYMKYLIARKHNLEKR